MQQDQTVSEMVEEILERQAKSLANRSGHSLGDARQAVAATEAGRQLRDLANGEHRREKARAWQVQMFWERRAPLYAPQRLGRPRALRGQTLPYSQLESYAERLA